MNVVHDVPWGWDLSRPLCDLQFLGLEGNGSAQEPRLALLPFQREHRAPRLVVVFIQRKGPCNDPIALGIDSAPRGPDGLRRGIAARPGSRLRCLR